MIGCRKSEGNTIFLVSLIIGIILFVALLGMGFNYLLLIRAQAQYKADCMALSLATQINVVDRIGEINELQEASRELILVSRKNASQSSAESNLQLTALCDRLVEDARSGHSLVEDERLNQIQLITTQVQDEILAYNRKRQKDSTFAFLGLKTFAPEILRVDLGRIANVNCNVRALDAIPELARFDNYKSNFDGTSKLYRCDINAKLPDSDSDLNFNFSSLPACIGNTGSPARNTNGHVFVPYETIFADGKIRNALPEQIPSAVQIYFGMDSILPWDQSTKVPIGLVATGSTSGASFDSKQ
jgi:hypothetical protein